MNGPVLFINYRQTDTSWSAEYIAEKLCAAFGEDKVFFDSRCIDAGDTIPNTLEDALNSVSVLLVVIGNNWIKVQEPSGKRRIDGPKDWVRREIRMCLSRSNCVVIPVLLDDANLPMKEYLPDDIALLSDCKGMRVRRDQKEPDIERLTHKIRSQLATNIKINPTSSKKRIVYESLSRNGRIDLSTLGNPYSANYDPDSWGNGKVSVYISFPKTDYIINAPRAIQLPAVAMCCDSCHDINIHRYLGSNLHEKLLTYPPSKLFNEDKEEILKLLMPLLDKGFVAGVTLPVRLFYSNVSSRKQKYVYGAMINSVLIPLVKFHHRIEYEIDRVEMAPIGNDAFESKLLSLMKSEVGKDIITLRERDIVILLRLLGWCIGSAINNDNRKWIEILQNG